MRKLTGLVALAGLAVATACSDTSGPGTTPQFSRQITFPDLQTTLQGLPATGAARVGIRLPATGLVAREVSLANPDQINRTERLKSRITDLVLAASGDKGTLTLEPGFQVSFSSTGTTFEADSDLTF